MRRANLFLVGNVESNAVLKQLAPRLPIGFAPGKLSLGGKTYLGEHLACYALFAHPDGGRYVAILAGNEPETVCWGSRVGLQLLPDFVVFAKEKVVEWGFWNNEWRYPAGRP